MKDVIVKFCHTFLNMDFALNINQSLHNHFLVFLMIYLREVCLCFLIRS